MSNTTKSVPGHPKADEEEASNLFPLSKHNKSIEGGWKPLYS